MKKLKVALLIIDADNDFVDPHGTLYVPKADEAMKKLSKWLENSGDIIDAVYASQDAHSISHIGHPWFWKKLSDPKKPVTDVTYDDIVKRKVVPRFLPEDSAEYEEVIDYMLFLNETNKKYNIWPIHSIDGSWGQSFPTYLSEALNQWSLNNNFKTWTIIRKGQEELREMHSIFTYSFPLFRKVGPAETLKYLEILQIYDKILIAGQAKDYCVVESIKDMIDPNLCETNFDNKLIFIKDALPAIDENNSSLQIYQDAIDNHGAKELKLSEIISYLDFSSIKNSDDDCFVVIQWPEIQYFMDLDGFKENSHLINDEEGLNKYGSNAYFIKKEWLNLI